MKRALTCALLLLVSAPALAAQGDSAIARAFDLERHGSFAAAADGYRAILERDPGNLQALFGLERSLAPLNRVAEMTPLLAPVLAARPLPATYAVALRVWLAAGMPDSARRVVETWARTDADPRAPYREWGDLLMEQRDANAARKAYELGRTTTGDTLAFAPELAQADVQTGAFDLAAIEWVRAARLFPGARTPAVTQLARAPERARAGVLKALESAGGTGRTFAALLAATWGNPAEAARLVDAGLPDGAEGTAILEDLVTRLQGLQTRPARLALARVIEKLAARSSGAAAASLQLEAARAYSDAGDRESARRMLTALAADPDARRALGPGAARMVIGVLISEGDLEEAERQLNQAGADLPTDDALALRRELALGWARAGDLDRAQRLVSPDSSVETAAIQGRLFLYKGDLANARRALRWAGPFAGSREEATDRTRILALLQPIDGDSLPALGAALWALDRGDTAGALARLGPLSDSLPAAKGGAELAFLMGQIEVARGDTSAVATLRRAVAAAVPATSPAAEYALARWLAGAARKHEAIAALEHLILTWPTAAVVPEARRLLEQLRLPPPASTT